MVVVLEERGQAVGGAQEEHGQEAVVLEAADPGTVVVAVEGVDTGGRVTVVLSHSVAAVGGVVRLGGGGTGLPGGRPALRMCSARQSAMTCRTIPITIRAGH